MLRVSEGTVYTVAPLSDCRFCEFSQVWEIRSVWNVTRVRGRRLSRGRGLCPAVSCSDLWLGELGVSGVTRWGGQERGDDTERERVLVGVNEAVRPGWKTELEGRGEECC